MKNALVGRALAVLVEWRMNTSELASECDHQKLPVKRLRIRHLIQGIFPCEPVFGVRILVKLFRNVGQEVSA